MYTTACPMATLQMGRKTWRARPRRKHWRFWRQIPPTTRLGGEPFRKARKENSSSWGERNSRRFADRGDDGLAAATFGERAGRVRNNGEARKQCKAPPIPRGNAAVRLRGDGVPPVEDA